MPMRKEFFAPTEMPMNSLSPATPPFTPKTVPSPAAQRDWGAPKEWVQEDICPLTRETANELGADKFLSPSENQRLYSRSTLKAWLAESGRARAQRGDKPFYISPMTRLDMAADAKALDLPAVPQTKRHAPPSTMFRVLLAGAAFTSVNAAVSYRIMQHHQAIAAQLPDSPELQETLAFLKAHFYKSSFELCLIVAALGRHHLASLSNARRRDAA